MNSMLSLLFVTFGLLPIHSFASLAETSKKRQEKTVTGVEGLEEYGVCFDGDKKAFAGVKFLIKPDPSSSPTRPNKASCPKNRRDKIRGRRFLQEEDCPDCSD